MVSIDQYLQDKRETINAALLKQLPVKTTPSLYEAMRYSIEAGGKRLRPILTIATAETISAIDDNIVNLACALEYIHTYSLIHDDLPAMDDSSLRRGVPTCHCVYGDAMAILAGDALLTLAFEIISNYGQLKGNEKKAIKITAQLSEAAGMRGMIGGQVLDLEAEGKDLTVQEIEKISSLKTGALLRASIICGGIAAGASESDLEKLKTYADNLGIAFQVIDDLLDCEGTIEETGKPTGADLEKAKATYPALLGTAQAKEKAAGLHEKAISALNELKYDTALLEGIANKIIERKN